MAAVQMRHLGRQRAVQALFSLEIEAPSDLGPALEHFWGSLDEPTPAPARSFAADLVGGVFDCRDELDEVIQRHSENWRVERMARVDRNVLRLAAYELLYTETPARVVINEAVEVARTFGAESSPAFVNGILDKLARAAGKLG
jgi:N utilization substance protein B